MNLSEPTSPPPSAFYSPSVAFASPVQRRQLAWLPAPPTGSQLPTGEHQPLAFSFLIYEWLQSQPEGCCENQTN